MSEIHPLLVHLPISLALTLPGFLLFLLWLLQTGRLPESFWQTGGLFQLIHVVGLYASMLSGEATRERLNYDGAQELVSAHQEKVELYFLTAIAVLVLLLVPRLKASRYLALMGSLIQLALCIWAGHAGSLIRHG